VDAAHAYLERGLTSRNEQMQEQTLMAVGNSRDESFLGQVVPLTRHEDEEVRAAAARSMRGMRRHQTAETLDRMLAEAPATGPVLREVVNAHRQQNSEQQGRLSPKVLAVYSQKLPQADESTLEAIIQALGEMPGDRRSRSAC
jgi:HEAT repeat protein